MVGSSFPNRVSSCSRPKTTNQMEPIDIQSEPYNLNRRVTKVLRTSIIVMETMQSHLKTLLFAPLVFASAPKPHLVYLSLPLRYGSELVFLLGTFQNQSCHHAFSQLHQRSRSGTVSIFHSHHRLLNEIASKS